MAAKKMILIDPDKFNQTKPLYPPIRDGLVKSILNLDDEMKYILTNNNIDERTKATAYQQVLQRYIKQSDAYENAPYEKLKNISIGNNGSDKSFETNNLNEKNEVKFNDGETLRNSKIEERVLKTVPKYLHGKASVLIDYLNNNPQISWDKRDQLVLNGKTVLNSNIIDIINDLLRKRKSLSPPVGWDALASVLDNSNTPREVIGNNSRWSFIEKIKKDNENIPKRRVTKAKHRMNYKSPSKLKWSPY